MTIQIKCDGILCRNNFIVDPPADWVGYGEFGGDGRYLFCKDCKSQHDWFAAQCPGCVESYPDCGLSQSFAYDQQRTITPNNLQVIRSGKCPFRTNGTFGLNQAGFKKIDLSGTATTEAGNGIANAIERYIAKYPAADK